YVATRALRKKPHSFEETSVILVNPELTGEYEIFRGKSEAVHDLARVGLEPFFSGHRNKREDADCVRNSREPADQVPVCVLTAYDDMIGFPGDPAKALIPFP